MVCHLVGGHSDPRPLHSLFGLFFRLTLTTSPVGLPITYSSMSLYSDRESSSTFAGDSLWMLSKCSNPQHPLQI